MTTPAAGEQFHFVKSGFSFLAPPTGLGETSQRGQTVTVTADLIELNEDRSGVSFLDLSPEEQVAKYGEPIWDHGPAPEELHAWAPNSFEQVLARDEARRRAWALDDPAAQRQALREVERIYGRAPSSQQSKVVMGDLERAALLRAEGLR